MGAAATASHVDAAGGTLTIAAGENGGVIRIPFLNAPYGDPSAFTVTLTGADCARVAGALTVYEIPAIDINLSQARPATVLANYTRRLLDPGNDALEQQIRASSPRPADTQRIQPGNITYTP